MNRLFRIRRNKAISTRLCSVSVNKDCENDTQAMIEKLREILSGTPIEEIIFLCVGSIRSIGDSLGPTVGTLLKEKNVPFHVYGTLADPIHAVNLEEALDTIYKKFADPFIVAIDASLGDASQVGSIFLNEGPLTPGSAFNKPLPSVGDHHIRGIVNKLNPLSPVRSLNNIDPKNVAKLARKIADIISRI